MNSLSKGTAADLKQLGYYKGELGREVGTGRAPSCVSFHILVGDEVQSANSPRALKNWLESGFKGDEVQSVNSPRCIQINSQRAPVGRYRVATPIMPNGLQRSCPGRAAPRFSVLATAEPRDRDPALPMLTGASKRHAIPQVRPQDPVEPVSITRKQRNTQYGPHVSILSTTGRGLPLSAWSGTSAASVFTEGCLDLFTLRKGVLSFLGLIGEGNFKFFKLKIKTPYSAGRYRTRCSSRSSQDFEEHRLAPYSVLDRKSSGRKSIAVGAMSR
jgi:hypothetical protein